jgi:hypothetical protein
MFRTDLLSIFRSLNTVFTTTGICHTSYVDCLLVGSILTSLADSQHNPVEITNKKQPCNRIYYSTFHWRLNMFWAAYRSSSEALTVFAAFGLHKHVVTGRSPHAYVNQRLQIQLELLMMSDMPIETCWAFNEQWNNKFYYKVASC